MHERREHPRTELRSPLRLSHDHFGDLQAELRNLSQGGIFVTIDPDEVPEVGDVIEVQIQGAADDPPVVKMRIVRKTPEGIGLQFA